MYENGCRTSCINLSTFPIFMIQRITALGSRKTVVASEAFSRPESERRRLFYQWFRLVCHRLVRFRCSGWVPSLLLVDHLPTQTYVGFAKPSFCLTCMFAQSPPHQINSFHVSPLQISDHLTWAGANAARITGVKHACHVAWPLFMLEQCGFLPMRSISGVIGGAVRTLRSCRFAPSFLKPPG